METLWTLLVPGCLLSWLSVAAGSPGARWQSCCSLHQLKVLPSLAQVRASIGPAQLSLKGWVQRMAPPSPNCSLGSLFKTIH